MIHLHNHTAKGSLLDATNTPEGLAKKAKELGMKAIALTEHGYMSSVIDFYKACMKEGVKAILGCEVYVCDDHNIKEQEEGSYTRYDHLILLAKNLQGYKNILKIVSIGFIEGFYYKPRVDFDVLSEFKEGLVVSSACLGGEIPRLIRKAENGDYSKAKEAIMKYKSAFQNYYLEVQPAKSPDQELVNRVLAKLSEELNVPLVATCDAHFLNKEDFNSHGIFIKINQDRDNEVYQDCYIKTEDEVFEVLEKHIGFEDAMESISNTHKIADMCNVKIELGKSYLPDFPIPKPFKDEIEYVRHLINKGFYTRGLTKLPKEEFQEYVNRAKYEFDIITIKGYTGYFLIVQDFLRELRDRNIYLGDGRGSADNSLVCYLLEITNVDPIKYKLNFSRFLTMERTELPDIDMDIQSSKKQDAVNLLKEKYGEVAQIATFITMQPKAGMDKLGKVLEIPYPIITEIKKYIPDGMSLKDALEKSAKLTQYQKDYPELFKYCSEFAGLPTSISTHAGGVVISPSSKEITEFTALALSREKEVITQLEMHDIESVGLVKMDCLATTTLDVISNCLDMIYGGK